MTSSCPLEAVLLTLLEELWLLALNEKSGKIRTTNLAQALTGAALIELAFDRRITTKGKREVGVLNSKPLNHPVLDAALEKIQSADNNREVRRWMFDLASLNQKMIYDFVAVGLVDQGIIEAQTQSLLGGLIKRKRWVLRNSDVRNEIITRMRETAFENKEATLKNICLMLLAGQNDIIRITYTREERRLYQIRMRKLVTTLDEPRAEHARGIIVLVLKAIENNRETWYG